MKTVLITGASRGIGEAIKKRLDKNYKIIAPSRTELDLLDDKSISKFIRAHKDRRVDIIINNAGINFPQWIEDLTDENLKQTIQVNLIAPIKLTQGFVSGMKKRRWGRIINISSAYGIVSRGKQIPYSASKHGINGFTKALSLELASYNILVNSVCPGFIATDMVVKRNTKEKTESIVRDIPLGRLGQPSEISSLIEFLISEENSYMTGATIVVDGGFMIK